MSKVPVSSHAPDFLLPRLLAVTDDCIQVLDAAGLVLEANGRSLGLAVESTSSSLVGVPWPKLWSEEYGDQAAAALQRVQAGETVRLELNASFAGAPSQWWQVTLAAVSNGDADRGKTLVIMRDISLAKAREQSLRASEERFHSAFDQSAMGMVIARLDGVLLRVNDAYCQMIGYSRQELEGRTTVHFTHPDDLLNNSDAIGIVTRGEKSLSGFEKRYIHKDGHVVWTRVSLSLVREENGSESTLIATVEDVTEQKRSQHALRQSEERLRLVFESVTDYAILTLDPKGCVTEWNTGAEKTFGYTANEIIGRDSEILWVKEDIERGAPGEERRVALEKGRADDDRWHQRKDGSRFFASGAVRPMWNTSGELQGFSKVCRDITAQREAEQELAQARLQIARAAELERARLAEVFMQSPSFMAVLSGREHRFELVNENYQRLVGFRDLVGKTVRESLPEVVTQGFVTLLDRVFEQGEEFVGRDVRVMIQRSAGEGLSERIVDFVYRPMRNASGAVDGIFVHGNDITERKLAERESVRLAEQRRLALDAANMGWWQFDLSSGLVYGDERFCTIFGLTSSPASYEAVMDSIHPSDRQQVDAAVRAATRPIDALPYSIEYRILRPGGEILWVRAHGQTYHEGEGAERRTVSFVGTIADTTDAKLAENALRESEARFRQLADAMPQIVFQAQPDGHVDYFNRRWYEYTGLPQGSVGFEHWKQVHEPDALERVTAVWNAALQSGGHYEIEYKLRRADGEFRWHLGRALPVRDSDGKVLRWYGTNTDIHEQKQLQEQNEALLESERAARSEAERASQMKDDFLATLSHELRTPLNAILGWVSILRGHHDAEDVAEGIEVIDRNARVQTQIIADLLDMSRIISGKVRLELRNNIDIAAIIRAAIDTVRPTADVKGIRIETQIEPINHRMQGDSNRLQQVFWNLLSNAVKFTPRDGLIQVALRAVESQLAITVRDSGQGIRADFLPYVFDRFRQADASTTRHHGGLGLGLAIVRQLVELHGGTVYARSDGPGQGSSFNVMFPIAPIHIENGDPRGDSPHPNESASRRPVQMDLSGVSVLVVDDEADARAMIARLLEGCDAEVRTASSAQQALQLVQEKTPDVLVSDIGMPGEDGYTLIKKLRTLELETGSNTPAIALTAYARPEDRMKAILAGFQFHVTKPVEASELLAIVAGLVGRQAAP